MICVWVCAGDCRCPQRSEALDLELAVLICVLGTKLRSSERAVPLNY